MGPLFSGCIYSTISNNQDGVQNQAITQKQDGCNNQDGVQNQADHHYVVVGSILILKIDCNRVVH